MIRTCMFAAFALLSANAIAAQDMSTLETIMATPMTQSEMAQVEGKAFGTYRSGACTALTCSSLAGAVIVGTNGG